MHHHQWLLNFTGQPLTFYPLSTSLISTKTLSNPIEWPKFPGFTFNFLPTLFFLPALLSPPTSYYCELPAPLCSPWPSTSLCGTATSTSRSSIRILLSSYTYTETHISHYTTRWLPSSLARLLPLTSLQLHYGLSTKTCLSSGTYR